MLAEKKALKALKSYSVIFDDMRFPNEFEMVKRNGGMCIRIDRRGEARATPALVKACSTTIRSTSPSTTTARWTI
jgi:hypothetical protein